MTARTRGWAATAALVLALVAGACTPTTPPAPADGIAGAPASSPVVQPDGSSRWAALRYGVAAGQFLDLYRPSGPGPHPVVVWFHGGYWTAGSRNDLPPGFRDDLLSAGYAVATVDYRLATLVADHWPTQVLDAKLAVKWVQANASALGVDAGRVVASGHSAGGHLALMVAVGRNDPGQRLTSGDPAVRGAVTFGAPVDVGAAMSVNPLADLAVRQLLGCGIPSPYCDASLIEPWRYLDAGDPDVLLISGSQDVVIPPSHADLMAATAADLGLGGVETATLPGLDHDHVNSGAPASAYLSWLAAHT